MQEIESWLMTKLTNINTIDTRLTIKKLFTDNYYKVHGAWLGRKFIKLKGVKSYD